MAISWASALLAQSLGGNADAFVVPILPDSGLQSMKSSGSPAAVAGTAVPYLEPPVTGSTAAGKVATLVAATAAAVGLLRSRNARRESVTTRHASQKDRRFLGWYGNMKQRGDMQEGNARFRYWCKLRRRSLWSGNRRVRFYRQQQILRDAGLTFANEGWHKWHPDRHMHNMYTGPESHPNNPYFPAASPGYGKVSGVDALGSAKTDVGAASSVPWSSSAGSAFVGGAQAASASLAAMSSSRRRAIRGCTRAASSLVMHAHKKAAASTKNQGKKQNPTHWGITKKGRAGQAVKSGQTLVRQKGSHHYAGQGVVRGSNYHLKATRAGVVQWRGEKGHEECFVVGWEYVNTKCTSINGDHSMLVPKKYEPWMGIHKGGTPKGDYMVKLREEWLESEEGKAWLAKKEEQMEKKNKFDEIRAKAIEKRRESVAEKAKQSEKEVA